MVSRCHGPTVVSLKLNLRASNVSHRIIQDEARLFHWNVELDIISGHFEATGRSLYDVGMLQGIMSRFSISRASARFLVLIIW